MKLALFVSSILGVTASLNAATINVRSQPVDLAVITPVVTAGAALVADGTGYVAIGATTLTTTQVGEIGTLAGLSAFQTDFTQFGTSATFGGPGIFNEPSLFDFVTSNSTTAGDDFVGNAVLLVAGNGADLNSSSELFVYEFGTNYGADAPLFTAEVTFGVTPGTILFGNTIADVALPNAGTHDGFQMGEVGVVPEPSAALLGVLGALGFLRRKR